MKIIRNVDCYSELRRLKVQEMKEIQIVTSSSFLGSTAQLKPWPSPQNPAEFLGGFSTIFFFTG
jgi:hypothetical protein